MTEFRTKALTAVERYLEHNGYAIIDSSPTLLSGGVTDIVANDGNALVFVEVLAKDRADEGFPEEFDNERTRKAKEMDAIRWLGRQDGRYCVMRIRFDVVSIVVLASDRALIKHRLSTMDGSTLGSGASIEPPCAFDDEQLLACATA